MQFPLASIAVLKKAPPRKIVLAHRPFEGVDGEWWHGIAHPQLMPGEPVAVLVSDHVAVEETVVLVEPHR